MFITLKEDSHVSQRSRLEIFKRSPSIVETRDEESSDELRYEFIYVYVCNYTNELWMQTKVLTLESQH